MPMPSLASRSFYDCYGLGTTDSCVRVIVRNPPSSFSLAEPPLWPTGLVVPSMTSPRRSSTAGPATLNEVSLIAIFNVGGGIRKGYD
ncbi:hypothetical protein M407DRAFT_176295 [Tulasnella calospora MUT 4182]|uniref:Uncharacterized protein n=1 Tax=Tulasnella calospora MUT 4182 TaxID=1051891 RepID=A0A0C3L6D0_9AGAM|nr:hypothetical protein M407DRAFT_176295 [Tulasnella calospora MUT 4182]